MTRPFIACTLLAVLSACQSYVAVPVQPATLVAVAQRSKVKVATKADVLLVVDDSYSMSGKQARLAAALQNFTQELDSLQPPIDYQAAVTTTSVAERFGACGPAGDASAAQQCDSDWGATGFACDSGLACLRTFPAAGQLHQGAGAPAAILRRDDYTAAQFAQYLSGSVQVGVDGARQPQGMEAMKLALGADGFLRDGAKLVVAFLTDAEDCSDPSHRAAMLVRDPKTGEIKDLCALESAGDGSAIAAFEPVATYANFLRGLKNADGTAKEIEIGAFVSLNDGTLDAGLCRNASCDAQCDSPAGVSKCQAQCGSAPTYQICVDDCAANCHAYCGGQVPGRRYLELAFAFSGVAANVCSDDASPALSRLSSVIGIPRQVLLRARPSAPELLDVRVQRGTDSLECVAGTDYDLIDDTDGLSVRFKGACKLLPDDTWDLRYLTNR